MCGRNSKHGVKIIVALFVLFAVLVSPCCAASYWGAFFTREPSVQEEEPNLPTSSEVVVKEQILETVPQESSETPSMTPSETSEPTKSTISVEASSALEEEFTNYLKEVSGYVSEVEALKMLSEKLETQLDALQKMDAISEEEYQTVKASLLSTVEANETQAEYIGSLEKELAKARRTRFTFLSGPYMGFENEEPLWGLGATLGIQTKHGFTTQVGVDYKMGTFKNMTFPTLDLDNLSVRTQFGWTW